MTEKKCWLCHRTEKESFDEFKEIVIEELKSSANINDREMLSTILQEHHYPFPSELVTDYRVVYNIGIDENNRRYINEHIRGYVDLFICPLCSSLFLPSSQVS